MLTTGPSMNCHLLTTAAAHLATAPLVSAPLASTPLVSAPSNHEHIACQCCLVTSSATDYVLSLFIMCFLVTSSATDCVLLFGLTSKVPVSASVYTCFLFFSFCIFGLVDIREACFGPCVVAAANTLGLV